MKSTCFFLGGGINLIKVQRHDLELVARDPAAEVVGGRPPFLQARLPATFCEHANFDDLRWIKVVFFKSRFWQTLPFSHDRQVAKLCGAGNQRFLGASFGYRKTLSTQHQHHYEGTPESSINKPSPVATVSCHRFFWGRPLVGIFHPTSNRFLRVYCE